MASLDPRIVRAHDAACAAQQATYVDPLTGLQVFTAHAHRQRGDCCGSGCRHCPFEHRNVPRAPRARLRAVPGRARRVVSLCPSITETVFALGRGDRLVGRTRYCVRPEGAVEALPEIGGTKAVKLDRLAALAPDLVLANQEENRREDIEQLRRARVPVALFFPRDVPSTAAYIRQLAALLEAKPAGEAMASELEALVQEPLPQAAAVAYLIWRKPWMVASSGTFIDSLLRAGGLRNVFAERGAPYPAIEAQELAQLDPDAVLLSSEPFPFAEKHRVELAEASGLPPERFRFVDGQLLSWHGVRTLEGLRYARQLGQELGTEG